MFNAHEIAEETISRILNHTFRQNMALYFIPPSPDVSAYQGPVVEEIALLCRVANGDIDRESADEFFVGEIMETTQGLAELLYTPPGEYGYRIPSEFWCTDLGQVIIRAQVWCRGDDLLTLSEAAELAFGKNSQKNRMRLKRMVNRGDLTEYFDPHETNPTHRTRVSRLQIEALIETRG